LTWQYHGSVGTNNLDALSLETDESAKLQWSLTFGDKGEHIAYSAVQTVEGTFAIAGITDSHGLGKAAQASTFYPNNPIRLQIFSMILQ
jgi:hypothetical protein